MSGDLCHEKIANRLNTSEYDVYLSHHHQVDAPDFCALLYDKLVGRGLKVFLDGKDTSALQHDLPHIISNSKCFVFVLSSGIFSSKWCLLELHAAVTANVPCVPLRLDGADVDASNIPTTINDTDGRQIDVKPLLNHLFKTEAIEHSNDCFDGLMEEKLMSHLKQILVVGIDHTNAHEVTINDLVPIDGRYFSYLWSSPLLDEFGFESKQLDLLKESQMIKDTIEKSRRQIHYRSAVMTTPELQYNSSMSKVVHLSGHGHKVGEVDSKIDSVMFEYPHTPWNASMGCGHSLTFENIRALNTNFRPQFVCVLVCHGETIGTAFLQLGASHVITIKR
jgi:hypothetical protein